MADEVTNPEAYAQAQEELARELEGGIKIAVPKEPEVNPEVYKDVESLLFRGFISVPAEINEVSFVFKSLNQHEMELLKLMNPEGRASQKFWSLFLAYGVLMIDGSNILAERERWLPKVAEMFGDFSPTIRNKVVRNLSEINRRASNAVILTECYATERYSRYRWYQIQGLDMTSTSVSGIFGTDRLGLNWAQLVWRALNQIEDIRDRNEISWENAKFIGGCMAGKGMSKVYQQDATRKTKEKEEQVARKDRILRQVLMGEKFDKGDFTEAGQIKIVANTAEELAAQLEKDLRGEKDWHDNVITDYETRVKEGYNNRNKHLEDMARTKDSEDDGKALLGSTDMRGLTLAQVQERVKKRKQNQSDPSKMVQDERLLDVMDRLSSHNGSQLGTTNRDPSTAIPLESLKKK